MAGSKSDYLEKKILNVILGGDTLTLGANLYVALSTAAYSDAATGSSMAEVAGTGYARVPVARNTTNWPVAAGASPATISNGTSVTFPAAGGAWGTVTSFYLVDAASAGNILYGADLGTPRPVIAGDVASFAPGTLVVTED